MPIHVEISSNLSSAFEADETAEVIRVLRDTARKLEEGRTENFKVNDINGNQCGKVVFSDD